MSLQDFKQQFPDLYREAYAKGIKAEKHRQYRLKREQQIRERVEVWWAQEMAKGQY